MKNSDYGDVVFPMVYEVSWGGYSYSGGLISSKNIRDEYSLEIRNILNGYADRHDDFTGSFLEACHHIKNPLSPYTLQHCNGRKLPFEWLNVKKTKEILKAWHGDPLDALYYLTRHGFIEKAVRIERKKRAKK
jgi:hypothetical protein